LDFSDAGEAELYALFMFIKKSNKYLLVNLGAAKQYPSSAVNDWKFGFRTRPSTFPLPPHQVYCGQSISCAYIVNAETHAWRLQDAGNGRIRILKNGNTYLGFKDTRSNQPYMGLVKDRIQGLIEPELASAQLSGTIIQFQIERIKIPQIQEV